MAQDVELGQVQQNIHIGSQSFLFTAGLTFDQVIVDYQFLASTSATNTLQATTDILGFQPFFRASNIQYQQGIEASEPASLLLLSTGLATVARWRRRRTANARI